MESFLAEVLWLMILVGFCNLLMIVFDAVLLKPRRIRSIFLKQGIGGPRPCFFYGNIQEMRKIQEMVMKSTQESHVQPVLSHNAWVHSIFPHLHLWAQQYGPVYMYSTGNSQHLFVGKPELMKALNLHKSLDLGRSNYLANLAEPMVGNSIISANGPDWAHQKKLIAPEFFLHKIKPMLGLMEESTLAMIRNWQSQVESNGGVADITVDKELKSLSADIISKACFGSSYTQGKQIFATLEALQYALVKPIVQLGLVNFRFLPTKSNREIWRLQKEVETQILKVVEARRQKPRMPRKSDDLLDALVENIADSKEIQHNRDAERFIVDNCKTIYFAGHETTALAASWSLMLLALYPEWQERVRAEITEICGDRLHDCLLDMEKFHQLKTLTIVIQESMRLYSPAIIVSREALSDIIVGDLTIPKGTNLWISVIALHRDPDNWGEDANEFRPERFAQGITESCKYPQSYIPFGFGSRLCIGKTFAMLELKIILSLLLSSFCFSLSPEHQHRPVYKIALSPEHGIRLFVRKVSGPKSE